MFWNWVLSTIFCTTSLVPRNLSEYKLITIEEEKKEFKGGLGVVWFGDKTRRTVLWLCPSLHQNLHRTISIGIWSTWGIRNNNNDNNNNNENDNNNCNDDDNDNTITITISKTMTTVLWFCPPLKPPSLHLTISIGDQKLLHLQTLQACLSCIEKIVFRHSYFKHYHHHYICHHSDHHHDHYIHPHKNDSQRHRESHHRPQYDASPTWLAGWKRREGSLQESQSDGETSPHFIQLQSPPRSQSSLLLSSSWSFYTLQSPPLSQSASLL